MDVKNVKFSSAGTQVFKRLSLQTFPAAERIKLVENFDLCDDSQYPSGSLIRENWFLKTDGEVDMTDQLPEHLSSATGDNFFKVNMETPVAGNNVVPAGGVGATNDISGSIPYAGGFTDMEAHLHDVQEYEDLDGKNSGLSASSEDIPEIRKTDFKGNENVGEHVTPPGDSSEAIYMEASPTADEVIRAGGFGATDDISSFLPVASDFTDFEAHIRDVEDYEDLEKDTTRPGLGWSNDST